MELVSEQRDFVFCPCKKIQRTKARETRESQTGEGVLWGTCPASPSALLKLQNSAHGTGGGPALFLFFSFYFFPFTFYFEKFQTQKIIEKNVTMKIHLCFTQIHPLLTFCLMCLLSPCPHRPSVPHQTSSADTVIKAYPHTLQRLLRTPQ